jgi:hypothetical protein
LGTETEFFTGWSPILDVYEDKNDLIVKVELPGMKKDQIELSLHDNTLTIALQKSHALWNVSSPVRSPGDISTSRISCAGRQKCIPTKRSGRPEPAAISVIDSVDVLDAKMVCGGQTRFACSRTR